MVFDPDARPRTIVVPGNGTRTLTFELPPGVILKLESIRAEIFNPAVDAEATLFIEAPGGAVIASKRQGEVIESLLGSGTATWALRLADEAASVAGGVIGAALRGGGQSIVGTGTVLTWNVEEWDTDNMFSGVGSSRLTCRTAGVFAIVGWAGWQVIADDNTTRSMFLRVNGSATDPVSGTIWRSDTRHLNTSNLSVINIITTLLPLVVGDYIECDLRHTSAANRTATAYQFEAVRLGAGP